MSHDSMIEEETDLEYAMFICEQIMEDIEIIKEENELKNKDSDKIYKSIESKEKINNNKKVKEVNILKFFEEAFNHKDEQQKKKWMPSRLAC